MAGAYINQYSQIIDMYTLSQSRFEEIEHTADIGIRAGGRNHEELFANLAFGMIHLLAGNIACETRKSVVIELEEISLQDLIVSWLSEINYQIEVFYMIPSVIDRLHISDKIDSYMLKARLLGSDDASNMQHIKMEIKAVTYHQIDLQKDDKGMTARVFFDI